MHERLLGIAAYAKQTAQHTPGVRLEDRQAAIERLRQDGVGSVTAEARQLAQCFGVIGQSAGVFGANAPRRVVEIAGTSIIAEPFPKAQHILLLRVGQCGQGRKRL